MNKKEQIKKIKELISMGNIVKITKDNSFDDMAVWLSNDDNKIIKGINEFIGTFMELQRA